jgi:hypothetical protein
MILWGCVTIQLSCLPVATSVPEQRFTLSEYWSMLCIIIFLHSDHPVQTSLLRALHTDHQLSPVQ